MFFQPRSEPHSESGLGARPGARGGGPRRGLVPQPGLRLSVPRQAPLTPLPYRAVEPTERAVEEIKESVGGLGLND